MADNVDALAEKAVAARTRRKEAAKTFGTDSAEYKAAKQAEAAAQAAFTAARQKEAQSTDSTNP